MGTPGHDVQAQTASPADAPQDTSATLKGLAASLRDQFDSLQFAAPEMTGIWFEEIRQTLDALDQAIKGG